MGLDAVGIVMELEKEFGVSIPDADASRVTTAADLRDCVLNQMVQHGRPADLERVWVRVREIIAEQAGIGAHLIYPEARLVEDLHLD
jgi:acyl carrier protein